MKMSFRGLSVLGHFFTLSLSLSLSIYIYIYTKSLATLPFISKLEVVFTRAAPAFDNLYMGRVFNINTVHKTWF